MRQIAALQEELRGICGSDAAIDLTTPLMRGSQHSQFDIIPSVLT